MRVTTGVFDIVLNPLLTMVGFVEGDIRPNEAGQVQAVVLMQNAVARQRGQFPNWVPVGLGLGICGYFALRFEPSVAMLAALGGFAVLCLVFALVLGPTLRPLFALPVCIVSGVLIAAAHVHGVSAPVLDYRYYGPIEGRIVEMDRSQSGARRLTLDRVVLEWTAPDRTPERVRVSLHGDQQWFDARHGDTIILTGHLSPPSGPVEPGGYDFRRAAWFDRLGAVGYTRTPVLTLAPRSDGWFWIDDIRRGIALSAARHMPDRTAGFATAILTGDRSDLNAEDIAALRATNLAHLLAISGMHMGLLTGCVFVGLRVLLSLWQPFALRVPVKKIAAIGAVLSGAAYLAISGGSVATVRAFIMVSVMFTAVVLDRRAITMRSVAVAATLVLVMKPVEVLGPGFQMSFAATAALVWAFGVSGPLVAKLPKWIRPLAALVISSGVAGLATAPFGAAHFNQIAHFGLLANLLAVPVMGMVVMPAAILTALLSLLGLEAAGFAIMHLGLSWILTVAEQVAAIPNGTSMVPAPNHLVLPLVTAAMCLMCLGVGRLRWGAVPVMVAALVSWSLSTRPAVLVSDTGALIGVQTGGIRSLTKATGDGFSARTWLENDGDDRPQSEAYDPALSIGTRRYEAVIGQTSILLVTGKTALADLTGCAGADVLITNVADTQDRTCEVFDQNRLRMTGALAINVDDQGRPSVVTVRDRTGDRPWTGQ